jgi:hypothetical protein
MVKMRRLPDGSYINLHNVNRINTIQAEDKNDITYQIITKKKIKLEYIDIDLNFKNENATVYFKKFGLFKVGKYYINVGNLVYLNVLEKSQGIVHVEFIFNNMTCECEIEQNLFNYWESHYL